MLSKKLTAIDFFCGAGGFSEGLRQQGFSIIKGFDNWQPAIDTHNLNHGLNDTVCDVLEFETPTKWEEIVCNNNSIVPDSDIIVGSPPCVSFSRSNKAGKADKLLGIRLIEAYLRVIAIKKHKKDSILKAWFMENVPNSRNYVKEVYSFMDLNLEEFAKSIGKDGNDIALNVRDNGDVLTAADYGSAQLRKRFVCGELCISGVTLKKGSFPTPKKTHFPNASSVKSQHVSLESILKSLPSPNTKHGDVRDVADPNYANLVIKGEQLTDHFYDTGVYKIQWDCAKNLKLKHPFMGKMSFPENLKKPSRTIMATRSASTREAILYKSEFSRKGNGEYRLPTIRETATIMGFPITYQFVGSEATKWRQIGNAVCPHLSNALASKIKEELNYATDDSIKIIKRINLPSDFNNLNDWLEMTFDKPPKRKKNARFRRLPIKNDNSTVELINFDTKNKSSRLKWNIAAYFGTGVNHKRKVFSETELPHIQDYLIELGFNLDAVKDYLSETFKDFQPQFLQDIYENDLNLEDRNNPVNVVTKLSKYIKDNYSNDIKINSNGFFKEKIEVPEQSFVALFSLLYLLYRVSK